IVQSTKFSASREWRTASAPGFPGAPPGSSAYGWPPEFSVSHPIPPEASNSRAFHIPEIYLVRHFGHAIKGGLRARLRESAGLHKPLSCQHGRVARRTARSPALALFGL